jgi:hypothetical protein
MPSKFLVEFSGIEDQDNTFEGPPFLTHVQMDGRTDTAIAIGAPL